MQPVLASEYPRFYLRKPPTQSQPLNHWPCARVSFISPYYQCTSGLTFLAGRVVNKIVTSTSVAHITHFCL
ncbi:hypothetical protein Asd1617_00508 [Shigella dysenteriae 1617]|uniref:Uncharacterized protein n=1 Tax=Shigella dysenteriae 1617 TaxID=754093 RepID=A0A0A6ZN94_SHIDY|nr:hypothetical protein Asd1617_00508 [Shigella dysenteriae 1617]